jgi:hypothetical protein
VGSSSKVHINVAAGEWAGEGPVDGLVRAELLGRSRACQLAATSINPLWKNKNYQELIKFIPQKY